MLAALLAPCSLAEPPPPAAYPVLCCLSTKMLQEVWAELTHKTSRILLQKAWTWKRLQSRFLVKASMVTYKIFYYHMQERCKEAIPRSWLDSSWIRSHIYVLKYTFFLFKNFCGPSLLLSPPEMHRFPWLIPALTIPFLEFPHQVLQCHTGPLLPSKAGLVPGLV